MRRDRGRRLLRRAIALGTAVAVTTNAVGAIIVVVLLTVVLPTPDEADARRTLNIALAGGYLGVAALVGALVGIRLASRRLSWLKTGAPPTRRERDGVVGLPWAITRMQLGLWLVAVLLFAVVNVGTSVLLAVEIGLVIAIGGLSSAASSYLLVERANRPVLAMALTGSPLHRRRATGVAWRTLISWGLGTGLPIAGLVLLSGLAIGLDIPRTELAVATFVLGLVALLVGFVVMVVLARSIAHPLKALRVAIGRLAEGEVEVQVPVTDATEVGIVQSGFNQMAAGLAERDRIRDLFGRHVGPDVARRALEEGVSLGGEVRDVAVLFVDVTGSTAMAERSAPTEVVDRLNAFLGAVVEVVDAHEGTVDAFQGDAALAVWGAPLAHEDPCGAALTAGRALAERLAGGPLDAGIGISAGRVVAGNIGAAERLQYTVIGDPVNEAARLSDRAKEVRGRVLASGSVVGGAGTPEGWTATGEEVLRGRTAPTALWTPTSLT